MLDIADIIHTALHEHDGDNSEASSALPAPQAHDSELEDVDAFIADIQRQLSSDSEIPNFSHQSPPLSLVSFRCMLQDTGYPLEVYLPGVAGSSGEDDVEPDMSKLRERWVGWGVEVPGESAWVNPSSSLSNGISSLTINGAPSPPSPHPSALQAKFPIPSSASTYLGALLKVYSDSTESFRPASTHRFIGLVSRAALPTPLTGAESDNEGEEPLLVPTLHVLSGPHPAGPSLPLPSNPTDTRSALLAHLSAALPQPDPLVAEYLLLALLSRPSIRPNPPPPLGTLSLNLYTRRSANSSSSPLNLLPALSALLPAVVPLTLTLPLLHTARFSPSATSADADADTTSLSSGILQLTNDTLLVIDESGLGEGGQLAERALNNLRALTDALAQQKVAYEYPYMPELKMDASLRAVVLSEGKSLLPVDINLPLLAGSPLVRGANGTAVNGSMSNDGRGQATEQELNDYRAYLLHHGSAAHAAKLVIPDEVGEVIQEEFVEARASASTSATSQRRQGVEEAETTLKRRMRIARLMALSYPDATLSRDVWARVVQMDKDAQARLHETSAPVLPNGTA